MLPLALTLRRFNFPTSLPSTTTSYFHFAQRTPSLPSTGIPSSSEAYKRWRHLGNVLPQFAFLHGNVDLGVDREAKVFGFLSDEPYPGRKLEPTRLLYPVDRKDYQADLFIAEQWRRATDSIEAAYYITIFGYSAPTTDVEARARRRRDNHP